MLEEKQKASDSLINSLESVSHRLESVTHQLIHKINRVYYSSEINNYFNSKELSKEQVECLDFNAKIETYIERLNKLSNLLEMGEKNMNDFI